MRVIATQFSLQDEALDIYFAGCSGEHCPNCHNPESWNPEGGDYFTPGDLYIKVFEKIEDTGLIKKVRLFGGEPLEQPRKELFHFLQLLHNVTHLYDFSIWLFTRFEIYDVPFDIRLKCTYVKTGRYLERLSVDDYYSHGVKLATSNQKVHRRGYDF